MWYVGERTGSVSADVSVVSGSVLCQAMRRFSEALHHNCSKKFFSTCKVAFGRKVDRRHLTKYDLRFDNLFWITISYVENIKAQSINQSDNESILNLSINQLMAETKC